VPELKEELHSKLRDSLATMLAKLDGLSECDRRRVQAAADAFRTGLSGTAAAGARGQRLRAWPGR
jgi:hypothetical protein